MLTRREVVLGGALTLLFGTGCSCGADAAGAASARTPSTYGCCLAAGDVDAVYAHGTDTRLYITGNEPMIPRSGDAAFDYALAQTLSKISDFLNVLPGFAYYDDYDGMNAYATPTVRLTKGDGTVLFGQALLQKLKAGVDHPEIAIAGVCAHEFGHILQFKTGVRDRLQKNQPTVKRTELQADFFSGFFAAKRKIEKPDYVAAVVAQAQYNFGDSQIGNPNHHGTPEERAAAVVFGFKTGFNDKKSLDEAINISTNYFASI